LSRPDVPAGGLRERKRAKMRSEIQTQALRLFRERGYQTTTVQHIADAAVVSESTVYRYFPTKADLVLTDELDPILLNRLAAQPPGLSALQAIRAAFASVLTTLPASELTEQQERLALIMSVPELRGAMLDQLATAIDLLADAVGRRTGRSATDPTVQALAGAVIGVGTTVMLTIARDPTSNLATRLDDALRHLETALEL
jgi:AcrR family transcriptional regulator